MATHVFIVNETTFDIHLKYMFAGTGSKENDLQVINNTFKPDSNEKNLISMIADISRIRKDDKVLFYVTGCKKIFGVFKVVNNPFYEPFLPNKSNYLFNALGKNLTFRVKIQPLEVFEEGISEHEALDEIANVVAPYQMCWSLIYRKLTGMRGCSCITDQESDYLINLLKLKNNKKYLKSKSYSYDKNSNKIIQNNQIFKYTGATQNLVDILDRMCCVSNAKFEVYLQAYITQFYDKENTLTPLLHINNGKTWVGNEVICSVGEQRIDILIINETDTNVDVRIIELKCETPQKDIIEKQIPWYVIWVDQYICPNYQNKTINIIPTIIAAKFKRDTQKKNNFYLTKQVFNSNLPNMKNSIVKELEFISFDLDRKKKEIIFKLET